MPKIKTVYACSECGAQFPKWAGQCNDCQAWNSLQEEVLAVNNVSNQPTRFKGYAAAGDNRVQRLNDVSLLNEERIDSGLIELNRVLGGGLVKGSVILLGGDPGIGKSTILLQAMAHLSTTVSTLYITGEESLQQIASRAQRLGLPTEKMRLLTETQVERIIAHAQREQPKVMVVDSIQTIHTELLQSAPGAVAQLRESTAQLVRYAKQTGTTLWLIGHVTKEGNLAGPRVLEHMVDTVLYFEGDHSGRFRAIRAVKNRFGAVNELGIFAMTAKGLREVNNPSAMLLSQQTSTTSGNVVMATWEGTRPLLVEIQALVDESHLSNPRRVTIGLEHNRLAMLLAVLHRHASIVTYDQDVFVNVVGGIRVTETAIDLAVLLAVVSSLKNQPLANDLMVFGEVGLSGEIRPVQSGQERLKEAAKHGFKKAIIAKANVGKKKISGMDVVGVKLLSEAITALGE
ncbi:MAG: DNA repair protein RadA [Gammaproteobacteria bacterium]|nr:DNA repair protein RadA [Gammaproteobacteria bacterium]